MAQKEDTYTETTVGSLVRKQEQDYLFGITNISKYVQFSMHHTLEKIDAYLNSKHTTGDTDSLDREKPFFNIVTAAANIWFRATDLDRKNIKVKSTKISDVTTAFLANVHVQDWMRRENFGAFLNEWGRVEARYGSAVPKFVEQDGRLIPSVTPWNRLIVDPVDFHNNVVVEILELTEAQLRKNKAYDKEMVDALCNALTTRKTLEGQAKDTKDDYIKLYEVHGELPLSVLKEAKGKEPLEGDEDNYVQQMHVISFVGTGKKNAKGDEIYEDFTLYCGKETKSPYMITHLIKEDGRTLAIGAVEHLFEAQWMQNHSVKAIKDQLDLASKLIFQTADGSFVGQNALSAIETGDILVHAPNMPLTTLANTSHDVTALQSFQNQWKSLGNEIAGISDAMLGHQPPTGTAWRQVETLLQESHDLFDLMTQNKGLDVEAMMREFILPFIKKNLDHSDEVAATLGDFDIKRIDSIYIKNKATTHVNQIIKEKILNRETPTPIDQAEMMQGAQQSVQESLSSLGNTRYFKPSEIDDTTWKEVLKDFEWEVEVDVTGENTDKDIVTTLNTMLITIAKNPNILQDPNAKLIFNKILSATGAVSPLELSTVSASPQQAPQPTPAQAPQPTPQPVT